MSTKTFGRVAATSLALLVAAQLSGCGGGGSDASAPAAGDGGGGTGGGGTGGGGTGGGGTGNTGSAIGVFLDSPIQGLKYTTTPSNISGTTNAAGQYTYNPGDTVTFSVGNLPLGTVAAQGTVTPLTVAQALVVANPSADVETITVNLLTFFQSLDADGDADNGITIGTPVANTMTTNTINFVAGAGSFTTSLANVVANVESATGTDLTVVSRAQATEHFVSQTPQLVSGTYVAATQNGTPITQNTRTLTLFENGTYLYGGHDADPGCNGSGNDEDANGNGVETGTFNFNPLTRQISFSQSFETNGSCGPATASNQTLTLTINGNVLSIQDGTDITYLVSVPSTVGTLAGTWGLPGALLNDRPLVVSFFPSSDTSGRYFMVDAMLDQPDTSDNTSSGIEEGCYTLGANGAFSANLNSSTCPGAIDTNDTAGLSHPHAPFHIAVDAHGRFRINEGVVGDEGTNDLVRLPLQAVTDEDRVGTWYVENAGVAPQADPNLTIVSFFVDGHYLLGGVQDDSNCNNPALPYQDVDGNGAEFGQLTASGGLNGVVAPAPTTDTDGECGLYDGTNSGAQRYLIVPSLVDNSLVLYPYDEAFGIVLKRVPSVTNSVIGAWLMDGLAAANPHLGVFLPGGVMFEVSAATGAEAGLWRSGYAVNTAGDQFTITSGGDGCIDTMGFDSCTPAPVDEVVSFDLDGTSMQIDVYDYTKITE